MKATLLTYNIVGAKQLQIELLCANLHISIRAVRPEEQNKTIESLFENTEEKRSTEKPFNEEMLVFSLFDDNLLEQFLLQARQMGMEKTDLKAVITAVNKKWTSIQLHHELTKEHQTLNK